MWKHLFGLGLFSVRVIAATIVGVTLLIGFVFGFSHNVIARCTPEIIFTIISVSVIAVAVYQVLVHETSLGCMSGMMVGMTVGMLAGFLVGYLVGATNGMFVGSLVGVSVGATLGAVTGRCCGIMGVMEGLMAGLMAGTMGPMLAVMLLSDQYMLFTWFFVAFCVMLFAALSIMVEREFTQMGRPATMTIVRRHERTVMLTTTIVTMLIVLIMVYAPRGPITIFSLR